MNRLHELLADYQPFHSELQMDRFIIMLSGGPTDFGRYKQALRELNKRYRGLKDTAAQIKEMQNDIDELDHQSRQWWRGKFSRRRCQIKATQKRMQLEESQKTYRDTEREFVRFLSIADHLKNKIGDLSISRRQELEAQDWEQRIMEMAARDIRFNGRVGPETLKLVDVQDHATRDHLLALFQNPKKLLHWHENAVVPLPEIKHLDTMTAKGFLE